MKKCFLITLLFLFTGVFAHKNAPHEFYVSITDMEYVWEARAVQVTMKLFTDDLEFALEESLMRDVALNVENEEALTEDYIRNYVFDHFRVFLNNQWITYNWVGKEYQNDVTWVFLEVRNVERFSEIRIQNTLLFELYANQANMLNLTAGGETQSFIFTKPNPEHYFHIAQPFKDDVGNIREQR